MHGEITYVIYVQCTASGIVELLYSGVSNVCGKTIYKMCTYLQRSETKVLQNTV